MDFTDGNENEVKAYEHLHLHNLAVQDALVILAIYASRLDLEHGNQEDIRRIETILEQCPLCVLEKEGIFSRIHKYFHTMQTMEPLKAVEIAAKTLTPKYRDAAFELATKVASQDTNFTDERKEALDKIAGMLGIKKKINE